MATYVSNNMAAATVNATGLVTAVANGTAVITASYQYFGCLDLSYHLRYRKWCDSNGLPEPAL